MNADLEKLSDRHFRKDPQGVLADRDFCRQGKVCIRIDTEIGRSIGGQHLIWMLVNLLSRQFGVVTEIVLDIPQIPIHKNIAPFGVCGGLLETLTQCVQLIAGQHIAVGRFSSECHYDVHFLLGSQLAAPEAGRFWRLYADGWRYYVGISGAHPQTAPLSTLSIGPYLAASYASAEAFKLFRGMKPSKGKHIEELYGSAWSLSIANSWSQLAEGPNRDSIPELPHFYFAGAGAVAQAAALALGSSGIAGSCTAIDHDELDLTNDNRYVLTHTANDGDSKVHLMARYLEEVGIKCKPNDCWWEEYVRLAGSNALNKELAKLEQQYKYTIVLSCVDENEPRHALQNSLPELILGGSTDGLTAKVSIFYLNSENACLKCHNPVRQRNEVVQKRIESTRLMNTEERLSFCEDVGVSLVELEKIIDTPACGKLTQSDLERFAAPTPQMSVGFVSATAGTLLAAQFIRLSVLNVEKESEAYSTVVATFSRSHLRKMRIGLDPGCECTKVLRHRWQKMWK
jgi:molybdopterin/thiamine biosynthesis adenylyltransferase